MTGLSPLRLAVASASLAVLGAGALVPASGAPPVQSNYYSASFSPNLVRYVTTAANGTSVTLTLGNCGRGTSPPANCAGTGSPAIRSVSVTLSGGWTAALPQGGWTIVTTNPVRLTRSLTTTITAAHTQALPSIQVAPTTNNAGLPQQVALCVSDTTSCLSTPPTSTWQLEGSAATLELPLQFTFPHSPVTGTPATSLCGASVQLTDYPAGTDAVPLAGVGVTLAPVSGSFDPSFSFTPGNTPLTNASGLATFGCDPNPTVGGPYQVAAMQTAGWPTIPSDTSSAFLVYTHFNGNCNHNCSDSLTGSGGTEIDTTSNSGGSFGDSVFGFTDQHFSGFLCGMAKVDGRPDVLQAATSDNSLKTVVITWSKDVTHKFTDTGVPHWQVCMQAPATFITDSGAPATPNGAYYYGTIPICGTAGVPVGNPCMTLARNRSMEIATITLPSGWAGDPYFH